MTIQVRVMAAQGIAELKRVEAQSKRTAATVNAMGAMTGGFAAGAHALTKWGSQVQWAGRQLQYNFTIPLAIAGGAATKFALDNERAMVRVVKVYGDVEHNANDLAEEIDALGGAFKALSNHFGVNQAAVISVAGDWAAAGASGIALAKAVRLTLETMILGEIEAAQATEALIAIQAQYGLTVDELARSIDILNMVENETGITMQGLIDGLQRSAGAARSAGIDVRHLSALMAALVPAAGSAAAAGNGLRTMVTRLLAPTEDANDLLNEMGLNVHEVGWQSLNGVQRLELLAESFKGLSTSQRATVSSYVASRWQINRFEILMNDLTQTNGYYQRSLKQTGDAQANFNQRQYELQKVLSSNPQRLKQMWTILQNALADIVQPMIPWIVYLAKVVADLFKQFSEADPALQKLVVGGLAFIAVFGLIIRYVGVTAVLFGYLATTLSHLLIPLTLLGKGLWIIASAPFKAIAAGFTAVVAAIVPLWRLLATGVWALIYQGIIGPAAHALTIAGRVAIGPAIQSWFVAMGGAMARGFAMLRGIWVTSLFFFGSLGVYLSAMTSRFTFFMMYTLPGIAAAGWAKISSVFLRGYVVMQAGLMRAMAAGGGIMLLLQNMMNTMVSAVYLGMGLVRNAFMVGWVAVRGAMAAAWAAMAVGVAAIRTGGAWMIAAAKTTVIGVGAWFSKLPVMIFMGLRAIPGLLMAAASSLAAVLVRIGPWLLRLATGPVGLIVTAVTVALVLLKDKVTEIWNGISKAFRDNGSRIVASFSGVVDFFNAAVVQIHKAFNSLPEGVRNAIMAVVDFIRRAAIQIYEWFSYLNPFARHSPSLVESVTAGFAIIAKQYASISNVGALFARAAAHVEAFKKLAASLNFDEWTEERADVSALMPQGLDLFNALVDDLKPLNALLREQESLVTAQERVVRGWEIQLNAANDALDAQEYILKNLGNQLDALQDAYDGHQAAMDAFANSGIQGQRAMSDAIFDNEMAQKSLRLEIMRLEEAGGSVEDLRDQLSKMQGDIEKLRGDANDLRAAGAGSDVLGPIQSEIDAMEAQYRALSQASSSMPINELQNQLAALERQGEILDLENSLQFDPLVRQVEQLVDGMNELPFDQIIAGINTEKSAMAQLQPALDAANAAHAAQKAVVDQLQVSRDALQRSYDIESSQLRTLQGDYQETANAIGQVEQALRMVSDASTAAGVAGGGRGSGAGGSTNALENFRAGEGINYPEVGGDAQIGREGSWDDQSALIEQWTQDLINETSLGLGAFDMFAPVREKWQSFLDWWNANAVPAWEGVTEGFGLIFSSIGEGINIDSIGESFGNAWEGIQTFWDSITEFANSLMDLFGPQLTEIWTRIVDAVGPVWEDLKKEFEAWGPTIENLKRFFNDLWHGVLKPLAIFIGTILIGILSTLFSVIGNVIGPVIEFIGAIIGTIIQFIRGFIETVTALFRGDFTGVIEGLATMFGAVWSAIVSTIEAAWEIIYGIVSGLVEGIVDFFQWLYDKLVGNSIIPDLVNSIVGWFSDLWTRAVEFVSKLVTSVVEWFQRLWTTIRDAWELVRSTIWNKLVEIVTNVRNKFEEIRTAIWDKIIEVRDKVAEVFGNVRDSIMGAFENVRDRIEGVFTSITNFIKAGINTAIRAVNSLITGLNKVADILPGLDWTISAIPLLAQGGAIPSRQVGAGFAANQARAIVGEGNSNYPEYVIPTDPKFRGRATDLFMQLAGSLGIHTDDPGLGIGGWLENATNAVKGVIGNGADLVTQGAEWLGTVARGAVSTIFRPVKNMVQSAIDTMSWQTGKHWTQAGLNNIWEWVTGADEAYKQAGNEAGANGPWRKPLNAYSISSLFGPRVHPITGAVKTHSGIDMAAPAGTAIYAAATGQLVRNIMTGGLGKYMSIDHGSNIATLYGHMSTFSKQDGWVKTGDLIGKVGSTGASTGPHLHYEIRRSGMATDPRAFMGLKGISLAEGGIIRRQAGGTLAQIGEGRYDEAVMPLPRNWRSGGNTKLASMTVQRLAVVGTVEGKGVESLQPTHQTTNNSYHFYGDLEFPNIASAADAEDFLKNLDDLAGGK